MTHPACTGDRMKTSFTAVYLNNWLANRTEVTVAAQYLDSRVSKLDPGPRVSCTPDALAHNPPLQDIFERVGKKKGLKKMHRVLVSLKQIRIRSILTTWQVSCKDKSVQEVSRKVALRKFQRIIMGFKKASSARCIANWSNAIVAEQAARTQHP